MIAWLRYLLLGIAFTQLSRCQDDVDDDLDDDLDDDDDDDVSVLPSAAPAPSVPPVSSVAPPPSAVPTTSLLPTDVATTIGTTPTTVPTTLSTTITSSPPAGTGATADSTQTSPTAADQDGGLSAGAKAGIGVGVAVIVLTGLAVWFFTWHRRRIRTRTRTTKSEVKPRDNAQQDSISPRHSLNRFRNSEVDGHYAPDDKRELNAPPVVYAHHGDKGASPETGGLTRSATERFELPGERATYELEGETNNMSRPQQASVLSPVSPLSNATGGQQQSG